MENKDLPCKYKENMNCIMYSKDTYSSYNLDSACNLCCYKGTEQDKIRVKKHNEELVRRIDEEEERRRLRKAEEKRRRAEEEEKKLGELEEMRERIRKGKRRERERLWKEKGVRTMTPDEYTPCDNVTTCCNENVHNIIVKMGEGKFKNKYIGDLFKGNYPGFDEDYECVQYIQEYVPRHLIQIECVLEVIINEFRDFSNPINVLDIGSGPATVPHAFCRILPRYGNRHKYSLKITTVEPSKEFNKMIDKFKGENTNESIEIVDNLECKVSDYISNYQSMNKHSYDWIIIANSISNFCDNQSIRTPKIVQVNTLLNKLISKALHHNKNDKILLTIIENNKTENYFPIRDYLKGIEEKTMKFNRLEIIRSCQRIPYPIGCLIKCNFYKRRYGGYYTPVIISKSFWFTLKK